jgi:hypothetical protein
MATIKVESIERKMNASVEVKLDVRTSVGQLIVPLRFGDQGSAAENEKNALREFRTWLQEALQALDAQGL